MARSTLKSVYFIYGRHRLLLREAVKRLSEAIGTEGSALDVVRLNAREDDADRVLAECQTLSFFGGRRLIVVADPLTFRVDAQKKLIPYIEDPNPQTVLVLAQEVEGSQMKRRLPANKLVKACRGAKDAAVAEYEIKRGGG